MVVSHFRLYLSDQLLGLYSVKNLDSVYSMYTKATVSVPENDPDLRTGTVAVSSLSAKRSRTPFYCTPKANERPERTLVPHGRWQCPEFSTDII